MVEPVYLDLHIHTSEDADNLNKSYDVDGLVSNIIDFNGGSLSLISLTDHNTINKSAYEGIVGRYKDIHVLLGAELHIRNYDKKPPYHAHIFFKTQNLLDEIDEINDVLDRLYPKKMVSSKDDIPHLDDIVNGFEKYDFLMLPHGGQNHNTFETSIPHDVNFDSTLERTIYYNQFDGFTSRSDKGTKDTIKYFQRLNINEFINLITGSDNYNPKIYPEPKAGTKAPEFFPTWMLAEPTFNGLRISLSEKNRLRYQATKPRVSSQFIKSCKLSTDRIDIDVELTPGLNVVIGESSSGKSLFIDSLYRRIKGDFEDSVYKEFGIDEISVNNPHCFLPHYINQNFLVEKINKKDISEIDIIKSQFPDDEETKKEVAAKLSELKGIIFSLTNCTEKMEKLEAELKAIPAIGKLIYKGAVKNNPISSFVIADEEDEKTKLDKIDYERYIRTLDEINELRTKNLFMEDVSSEVQRIMNALITTYEKTLLKGHIKTVVDNHRFNCDTQISDTSGENATIESQKASLVDKTRRYVKEKRKYYDALKKLSTFDYKIDTKAITKGGNQLFIENKLIITEEKIIEAVNKSLKEAISSKSVLSIPANKLYKNNWSDKRKIRTSKVFSEKIYDEFNKMNEEKYKIITKDNVDFDSLSPGWKTAVILDLIFANTSDNAPLIIDQPEDNLASSYLNGELIEAIHRTKQKRQIIIVTHIATIPMLGDAQNVIVCRNKDDHIIIRNAPLEGDINNKDIVDVVAKLTDGGKSSIKKRFKKYNLRKYRGDNDED